MTKRENRGKFLQVPFSQSELDQIAKHAEKQNCSMAAWAKSILLKNLPR